ncbi:MAG TPA: HupE/UreJ family protein [Longimicrobiales bacterium]|nr:HupE/UreJ family protein [Longimicrobiales bacterium]
MSARPARTAVTRSARRLRIPARAGALLAGCTALLALAAEPAFAHGVAQDDALFFLTNDGPAIGPFLYLGAKHMFTGYDHLLFLVGVLFFLHRMRDVALYVSLFTLGHSVTLLAGVLLGLRANPFAVDAIIGLSVVYKAFDNMDGFGRLFGFQPSTRAAVLVFGLFHGFGLATALQDYALSPSGLLTNMVSFNVGVELGQMLALTFVLIALAYWRSRPGFARHAFAANVLLMAGGFTLVGYQLAGWALGSP